MVKQLDKIDEEAINYNKSIQNEAAVEEARSILKSMGYDPNDYGL